MKKTLIREGQIVEAKKERKATEHTPEFIAKHQERLKNKLIAQIKAEDPRNFINDTNIIRIEREPDEEYYLIPETTRYYVSNHGHALKLVYDKFTDIYLEHPIALCKSKNKTERIYSDINIQTEDGEYIRCRLSRAMAKTFLDNTFPLQFNDNDKRIVDHIDNNSENDHLSNLRIGTQSDNIKYAIYQQGRHVGAPQKKCYAYNVNTHELREYPSTGELCRDIWNSSNKGYFHSANTKKSVTKHGWRVGYDKDELKNN